MSAKLPNFRWLADLTKAISGNGPGDLELQASVGLSLSDHASAGIFAPAAVNKDVSVLSGLEMATELGLTTNNRVASLTIIATPADRAIYTQTGFSDMGNITTLSDLSITGQVSIITRSGTTKLNS